MPHVVVKMLAGRSDEQKRRLAAAITQAVIQGVDCGEGAVSVAITDIAPDRWDEDVYDAEIATSGERLFKRPGYGSMAG